VLSNHGVAPGLSTGRNRRVFRYGLEEYTLATRTPELSTVQALAFDGSELIVYLFASIASPSFGVVGKDAFKYLPPDPNPENQRA
jgi:hypothetical protein